MNETQAVNRPTTSMPSRGAGGRQPGRDLVEYLKQYAKERPDVAALWCFGIGFILGWKLKPW
jgi:hypothetical protein